MRGERFAAPIVALLLLTTAVGAGVAPSPVGTASAAGTDECGALENLIHDLITYQNVNEGDGPCSTQAQINEAVEEMEESDANQTKVDIYEAGLSTQAETETSRAVFDNYLNDSQSVAWMKAEMAIAEAYKNGSSKAVAKSKAREAIADYYAARQISLLKEWNVSARSIRSLENRTAQENISEGFVYPTSASDSYNYSDDKIIIEDRSVPLVNGSSAGAVAIGPSFMMVTPNGTDGNDWSNIWVSAPNSNYDEIRILTSPQWNDRWEKIQTLNNDLQADVDPFVNNTWSAYQDGRLNSSDVLNRNTLMFEYGVDATNNSSQNLYNSVAALSTLGLDAPELNGTGTMSVEYDNVTYNGLVLAREAPNGSWSANTTYNAGNISGPVMLVTTDGQRIEMSGSFRIGTISAEDGGTIDDVKATKTVYKTANVTEQLEKMQRILELRQEIEDRQQTIGVGAGSDVPMPSNTVLVVIGGAAAVLLLTQRQ